jgi:N-methylhydantoinase B
MLGSVQRSDVEDAESRSPWRYLAYEFRPDSMDHGRWRGAPGIHWAIRNEGEGAGMPTGNSDGETTIAPAVAGGEPAPLGRCWLERDGEQIPIHTHRIYWPERGDVLVRHSGGGAGIGNPRDRDPAQVREDYRNGLISAEVARAVYGVDVEPLDDAEHSESRQAR